MTALFFPILIALDFHFSESERMKLQYASPCDNPHVYLTAPPCSVLTCATASTFLHEKTRGWRASDWGHYHNPNLSYMNCMPSSVKHPT